MIADAEQILRICGLGTYLHVGCDTHTLVFELLKRSLEAYGIDNSADIIAANTERAPGKFFQGSLRNYPFNPENFDTIVIGAELLEFNANELLSVLGSLTQMTKHNLVIYFPASSSTQIAAHSPASSRLFWEQILIKAGFRRHPRGMLATSYQELENERMGALTFFEKIPAAANQQFSLQWLLATRDLHMDMLREAGRRSDGHVSRYVYAANKIRPGDVVLDAACGMGYGTAVLAACSPGAKFIGVDLDNDSVEYATVNYAAENPAINYHACDVTNMAFLPDHSVDAIISFETIEHVPDYDAFLKEAHRVLKPDGRFIGSVPHMWCDETGNDPNPYHFHVFDWNKLNQAISKYFIVDERVAQVAGGGYKLHNGKRVMQPVPVNLNAVIETEWWVVSACANPLAAQEIPYSNPFVRHANSASPEHVNFEKYYDNPWLYRVMVQLGERLTDKQILADFCSKVALEGRVGSADQGAAICVLAYQLLESGNINLKDLLALSNLINEFDAAYDRNNIHAWRWAISLHYVGGRLLLALGQREEALDAFTKCTEMDPLIFSPLLATKTISARMYAGLLYTSVNNLDEARNQFKLGVQAAHRAMQGDWNNIVGSLDNPLAFGLPEATEMLEIASQCAQALNALNKQHATPGYFWDKINLKRFGLVEWNKSIERENENLRQRLTLRQTERNALAS